MSVSLKPRDSAIERYRARSNVNVVRRDDAFTTGMKKIVERMEAEDVEGVYFQINQVDGRVLGKLVMREFVEGTARAGVRLFFGCVSDYGVNGEVIGFGNETEEGLVIPDPETFQVLPWEPRLARVWCNFYDEDTGDLLDQDLRGNLMRLEAELEEQTGLRLVTGIEPEMMWLKPGHDGGPPTHSTESSAFYHIAQFHELEPPIGSWLFHRVVSLHRLFRLERRHLG